MFINHEHPVVQEIRERGGIFRLALIETRHSRRVPDHRLTRADPVIRKFETQIKKRIEK